VYLNIETVSKNKVLKIKITVHLHRALTMIVVFRAGSCCGWVSYFILLFIFFVKN